MLDFCAEKQLWPDFIIVEIYYYAGKVPFSSLLKKPHAMAAKSAKESLFRGTLRPWRPLREASSGSSTGC